MWEHDMVAEEDNHIHNKNMDVIMDGLRIEYYGTESRQSIKRMKICCGMVLQYYEMYPLERDGGDIQQAKMLLACISRDCPEHLI